MFKTNKEMLDEFIRIELESLSGFTPVLTCQEALLDEFLVLPFSLYDEGCVYRGCYYELSDSMETKDIQRIVNFRIQSNLNYPLFGEHKETLTRELNHILKDYPGLELCDTGYEVNPVVIKMKSGNFFRLDLSWDIQEQLDKAVKGEIKGYESFHIAKTNCNHLCRRSQIW